LGTLVRAAMQTPDGRAHAMRMAHAAPPPTPDHHPATHTAQRLGENDIGSNAPYSIVAFFREIEVESRSGMVDSTEKTGLKGHTLVGDREMELRCQIIVTVRARVCEDRG
jgi:hypothetical protein